MASALPPPMIAAQGLPVTVASLREATSARLDPLAWSPRSLERCDRDSALLKGAPLDKPVVDIANDVRQAGNRLSAAHRGRQTARRTMKTLTAGTGTAAAWWMLEHAAGLFGPMALLAVTAGIVSRGRLGRQMDRIKEQAVATHLFMDGLERLHDAALMPAAQHAVEWYSWRQGGSSRLPSQYREGIALSYLDIFRQSGRPKPDETSSFEGPAWGEGLTWLAVHASEDATAQLRSLKDNPIATQRLRAGKALKKVRSLAIRLGLTRSDVPELFVDQYADALSKRMGSSWMRHLLPQAYQGWVRDDGFELRFRMVIPASIRPVGITEDPRFLDVALTGHFIGQDIVGLEWILDPDGKGPGGRIWAGRYAEALLEGLDIGTPLGPKPRVEGQCLHIPPGVIRNILLKLFEQNAFLDPAIEIPTAPMA